MTELIGKKGNGESAMILETLGKEIKAMVKTVVREGMRIKLKRGQMEGRGNEWGVLCC